MVATLFVRVSFKQLDKQSVLVVRKATMTFSANKQTLEKFANQLICQALIIFATVVKFTTVKKRTMKFYDREKEIARIQEIKEMAYTDHSRLTVLTGRRRIGKTALIRQALQSETLAYRFVSRKSEADLCKGFCTEIELQLSLFVPKMDRFMDVFRFMMEQGKNQRYTVVIDEFQEFININNSIYSDIQNYWDQYRLNTHINFIVCGSIYSLMTKLFQDNKEPLFGRAGL